CKVVSLLGFVALTDALLLIGSAAFDSLRRKATLTDSGRMTSNSEVVCGPGLCAAGVPEIADRERHLIVWQQLG
ncbi:MAG TPA: hypothetical protein VFV92_12520, partial [Candidatus Bathyarchaeia archaeon]|nr:hypothetical protein [Candidatus Bathyarchaeia archaeon]